MARSRRRNTRRTTSQRAAGLIALALPAPIQRVADTRLGSLLMLVGVPAMAVFGLLNVHWQDGFPTFSFNRDRATELRKAANEHLSSLEQHASTEDWGQSVAEFFRAAQGPNPSLAPFPSTSPQPSNTGNWQQQQQQQYQYQQQQYTAQYDQQALQRQPQYSQPYPPYPSQPTQPAPNNSPYPQPYPQPNPQWPGGGYQTYQGAVPTQPGTPGTTAAPSGYTYGYPAGYSPQLPYNGYPVPASGYGNQGSYTSPSGQLLRY